MSNSSDLGDNLFSPQKQSAGNITLLTDLPKYGFANKISGALTAFEVCFQNLFYISSEPNFL